MQKNMLIIFFGKMRDYVLIKTVDDRTIGIKDLLWEFFQERKASHQKLLLKD